MFGKTKVSLIAAAAAVLMTVIAPASQAEERVGDPFTIDVCPVSGAKLDSKGDPVVMIQGYRLLAAEMYRLACYP